ncbi:nuclear transport factor 2 family protein [Microscilla marina]|uniref:Nuclear transport factor 2 family protein n=1 Tax=Microscilla marina ATCC 23134 TaxID=313606 RepID=A1ZL32_MICM2|nr:nuclear transport factor 2 family protein [Microscilla marina]EAY28998.1 hypothetical protein M23134_00152 [Microscilla marina ATCC 23134]
MYIKKSWITLFAMIAIVPLLAFTKLRYDNATKKAEVKQHILKSYIHGAFNELNPEAMAKGFHPEFAIFSQGSKDKLRRYPIGKWVAGVKKRKAKPDFDPEKNKWAHKFPMVDVTGNTASAKVELYKKGKLVYTDYLSLYKYDDGWRIVAKVYHKHKK